MDHILAINSSVSGEGSISRGLVQHTVERLLEKSPKATLTCRDLAVAPVPHLTPATIAGIRGTAASDAELAARTLSDELIAELQAADVIVIGAPMYNFSIPSSLRAWFDHVLRPRVTFKYGEAGVEGLISGKRAIIIESRGGIYTEGPTRAMDFQEPYLKTLLAFIGITDVAFIHAEKIGFGPDAQQLSLAKAREQIDAAINPSAAAAAASDDAMADASLAGNALMQKNLDDVFSERDAARRLDAIRAIYWDDAVLHEPDRSVRGHDAISQAVTDLLAHLPANFTFSAIRPASSHNGIGRLQWTSGPPEGPAAVTGLDVAAFDGGRIRSLHVFLDQANA